MISPKPNSRFNLSLIISICKSPKNPKRNPLPKAGELSGSKDREASVNFNFSKASFNSSN